jgi:hypothetical protein
MIVDVLLVKVRGAMGVCIIALAEDSCVWEVCRKKITEPEYMIGCCPSFLSVSIEPVDSNNASADCLGTRT